MRTIRAAFTLARATLSWLNNEREWYPGRLAALDALLITALTYGLGNLTIAAINFAGNRWPIGATNALGYEQMYFGTTNDWLVLLTGVALVTFMASALANLSIFDQPQRRSVIKTTLAVTAAVTALPVFVATLAYLTGTSVMIGDLLMLVALLGLIGVPAALTLTRPGESAEVKGAVFGYQQ